MSKRIGFNGFYVFLIKRLLKEVVLKLCQIKILQINFINELLDNSKKEDFNLCLTTIFGSVDLADMQLISKYNKGIKYLLCAIDLFSKYAWVVPLKDKKVVTIVNAFQSILDSSGRKPNKI